MTPEPPYREDAVRAARTAGELLLERFRRGQTGSIESKGLHDYVTAVDREAEGMIVGFLSERYPDHAVMAEEGSPGKAGGGFRWIIDPLDGTTNFIHGVPVFSVSIALEDEHGLLAGAIYDPTRDEMFHAGRGAGAVLNGDAISCSSHATLDRTVLATGFPFRSFAKIDGYLAAFRRFMQSTSGIRRAGSAALDLAYTACGRYDGFWETGLSPWDMAAGALLVREAGGTVTDFDGGEDFLEAGEIVASGKAIHAAMLRITREHLL
jgi:myo-inositol-1(or 4)-monophosphatase